MTLHVIHGSGARVIPLPARTRGGIGDGAISTGLIHMTRVAGAQLGLTGAELDTLTTGLAPNATVAHRRAALVVLADRYNDWSATPEGVAELLRLWTYLAPHVAYSDLAAIAQEQAWADDAHAGYPENSRKVAAENAAFLLDRAARRLARAARPVWWNSFDPGPGAA